MSKRRASETTGEMASEEAAPPQSGAGEQTAENLAVVSSAVVVPEAQHEAWYQLLRAHSKVTQNLETRLLRAHQIPHHWYDVLVTLEKAPEQRLRMSELADNVATTRSTLTRLVDRLESEGLLRREACPDDRRGFFAVLTEAGAKARLAAWPIVSRAIVELFASTISPEEAQVIAKTLRRVGDSSSDQ